MRTAPCCIKNPIEVLCRQWHFANEHGDVYFRPKSGQDGDETVHHPIKSEQFLNM